MAERLRFPAKSIEGLEPHVPPPRPQKQAIADVDSVEVPPPPRKLHPLVSCGSRPFVTLTFATSLDSSLSLAPGVRTQLSGPESKAMTHYLRSRHEAICVGVSTAIADDPGLNCRLEGVPLKGQPRPIVIDPHCRWQFSESSKVLQLARDGLGLAPFIITSTRKVPSALRDLLEAHGGKYIFHQAARHHGEPDAEGRRARFTWDRLLRVIVAQGLHSIMIEGGGQIINSLLESSHLIDSVIITIAPTWLGQGGVVVSPRRKQSLLGQTEPEPPLRLDSASWQQLGEDVVLCGRIASQLDEHR